MKSGLTALNSLQHVPLIPSPRRRPTRARWQWTIAAQVLGSRMQIQGFESASRYGMTLCSSPTHITDIVGVDPTPVSATTRNSTSYTQSSSDSASSSVLAKRKCSPVGRDPATSRVQRQRLSPPAPEVLSQPVLGGAQDTYWLSNDSVHLGGYMYAGGGQDVDIGQRVVYPEAQYIGLEELYNIGIGSGHSC